jgi:hypothetical protein
VFAAVIVDAITEVEVELLTELAHLVQDAFGRLGVFDDRATNRGEAVFVEDIEAMRPRQEIERRREVFAPLVRVVTPGHRVDEIKRWVAADKRDRPRP